MRTRQDDFNKSTHQRITNNYPQRPSTRAYDTIKARIEPSHKPETRNHNSPDMNRYRQYENRTAQTATNATRNAKTPENEERERPSRKEREEPSPEYARANRGKARELNKNSSNPSLKEEEQAQQEGQEYMKLHEKLTFIESKIADMKRHVQKKREEKQQLVETRRRREQKREEERIASQTGRKVSLKQFVTQVP